MKFLIQRVTQAQVDIEGTCVGKIGKTNLSIRDVQGSLLMVSQFTLYANCHKGNRPTFNGAGNPTLANELYQYIVEECRKEIAQVETGRFGADMQVSLVNDGPFTLMLEEPSNRFQKKVPRRSSRDFLIVLNSASSFVFRL